MSGKKRVPPGLWDYVMQRDHGCVAHRLELGLDRHCFGRLTLDHVRASGALGMKSRSTADNLVTLCGQHHYDKTLNGRAWRPVLLNYLRDTAAVNRRLGFSDD